MSPREPKLQRWTDLIAALLRRHYPATFEELARDVPAYGDGSKKRDAVMRMFERDKDELRSFGISVETVPFQDDAGEASGYKLDRKGFYMPYLSLAARGGKPGSTPRKPDKYGYRALASLVFEPDELGIVSDAAERVRALGDPVMAEEAESAIRKLSFDLPIPLSEIAGDSTMAVSAPMRQENIFELLNDALERRKVVSFDYHTMSTDRNARRKVEPYGLFFLSSHWYLAGRDADKSELRNFRLNRMWNLELNSAKAQSADYEIPEEFNLRQHARSKQSWELGETDGNDAIVDFLGGTGASKAAARLGVAVEGAADRRKFRFHRVDSFARWLLSFGGEAVPIAPEQLVTEFNRQIRETHAVYAGST
ncbi:MAG: WYL domain-containing protein [Gemmatimonadales bacterium]